ncbi:MAG: ATP-binding cassette domain-containing protein [Nitrospira sp.]|nr:ATP-binding cassette domain-containing protein [bacterium]MBL7050002.1 ATP-binding cassette domain-containing protein [Nitrospira sp.]
MIEFDNVSLSFGKRIILDKMSFRAEFYEKIAVLGGSGEGKTTLLKLILGLLNPDSGRILIDGRDITVLSESEMRESRMKFSIVFQEGALFDSMNVYENVAFSLREYSALPEEEIEAQVRELLAKLDLEHAIYHMPEELSGGMQRRVAIARSLSGCKPLMMLYDEATTGLDPLTADNICQLINELAAGESPQRLGFIIVTHKVTDAVKVADRYMYLRQGKIAFDGDLSALKLTADPELAKFVEELHYCIS